MISTTISQLDFMKHRRSQASLHAITKCQAPMYALCLPHAMLMHHAYQIMQLDA